jgi:hypothetical protein
MRFGRRWKYDTNSDGHDNGDYNEAYYGSECG